MRTKFFKIYKRNIFVEIMPCNSFIIKDFNDLNS